MKRKNIIEKNCLNLQYCHFYWNYSTMSSIEKFQIETDIKDKSNKMLNKLDCSKTKISFTLSTIHKYFLT